ncbi:DMT family transporter [Oryzifoliimicrobium ureilyticus]|uniref:DMT family transporter n=1 Tax=Oryzifoliimicrobium ureilyticus TaxID=3113724 RepID=UPI00307635F1
MSPVVIALALFAAILHASWNAFLHHGGDRLWTVTVMSFASTVAAIPLMLLHPLPPGDAWIYIVLSAALQTAYSVFLVAAYRFGELGQVYPIVRGTVPLLVTVIGFLVTRDLLAFHQVAGVILVALGILSLLIGKARASAPSILLAMLTGAIIATYATVDSIGVRRAGDSGGYAAWVLFIYGLFLPATFMVIRRRLSVDFRSPATWKALGGGLVSMLAYGAVVAAFALGPAGPISALRETSVVFAALIGWLFLGERLSAQRALACVIVAAGAILIGR